MRAARLGDLESARSALEEALAARPPPADHELPSVLVLVGRDAEASALLEDLKRRRREGGRFPCMDAFVASVYLGELDQAFVWLNRAIDQRERDAQRGRLAGARDDARFQAALERTTAT